MKIKILTVALLAYYGSVSAQVEINLNKVVSFKMPAGTEKFRDERYISEMSILSANSVVEKSTHFLIYTYGYIIESKTVNI